MSPLEEMVRRAEGNPHFLACLLALYARSEKLSDAELARELGCNVETLVKVRLCAAPRAEPPTFREDVAQVADRFGLDRKALTRAVRRGQVVLKLQAAAQTPFMAARDRTE